MEPLVSVICITRNHERFCVESLDSVLNQSYRNIELIILDAASTDSTVDLIDKWLVDKGVTSIFLKESELKPLPVNLNKALAFAKGEFVQFLSLDDVLMTEKIEKQTKILVDKAEIACVYSDAMCIDEQGNTVVNSRLREFNKMINPPSIDIYRDLLCNEYFICAPTILWRTNIVLELGGFNEQFILEDLELMLMVARNNKVQFLDFNSVRYRIVEGSLSHSRNIQLTADVIKIYLRENKYISEENVRIKLNLIIFKFLNEIYKERNFKFRKLFLRVFLMSNLKRNYLFFICYWLKRDYHVYKYLLRYK